VKASRRPTISAVDIALHDLKARILDLPLATLLGRYRDTIPIYGSGGFTTYTDAELQNQLGGWVERDGCVFVKMKVGTNPQDDPRHVSVAKKAIGSATLFVMRTAPTRSSRPWTSRHVLPNRRSAGSRSRYRRTICVACAQFASAPPP
jgi:hypothetical protein